MNVPCETFDLSVLTYPQFLKFFFDRPVVGDEKEYDLFHSGIDSFVATDPATVVAHLEAMCRDLSELPSIYSLEQLDQGLWALFGAGIRCGKYLFDCDVNRGARKSCVESMYLPFKDVVARRITDIRESFYWMWWDTILHDFNLSPHEYEYGNVTLAPDQSQMVDAIYQTLSRILDINHRGCQWCALHGMGHLYHPLKRDAVQSYLNLHREDLNREDVQWLEACRDGSVL